MTNVSDDFKSRYNFGIIEADKRAGVMLVARAVAAVERNPQEAGRPSLSLARPVTFISAGLDY